MRCVSLPMSAHRHSARPLPRPRAVARGPTRRRAGRAEESTCCGSSFAAGCMAFAVIVGSPRHPRARNVIRAPGRSGGEGAGGVQRGKGARSNTLVCAAKGRYPIQPREAGAAGRRRGRRRSTAEALPRDPWDRAYRTSRRERLMARRMYTLGRDGHRAAAPTRTSTPRPAEGRARPDPRGPDRHAPLALVFRRDRLGAVPLRDRPGLMSNVCASAAAQTRRPEPKELEAWSRRPRAGTAPCSRRSRWRSCAPRDPGGTRLTPAGARCGGRALRSAATAAPGGTAGRGHRSRGLPRASAALDRARAATLPRLAPSSRADGFGGALPDAVGSRASWRHRLHRRRRGPRAAAGPRRGGGACSGHASQALSALHDPLRCPACAATAPGAQTKAARRSCAWRLRRRRVERSDAPPGAVVGARALYPNHFTDGYAFGRTRSEGAIGRRKRRSASTTARPCWRRSASSARWASRSSPTTTSRPLGRAAARVAIINPKLSARGTPSASCVAARSRSARLGPPVELACRRCARVARVLVEAMGCVVTVCDVVRWWAEPHAYGLPARSRPEGPGLRALASCSRPRRLGGRRRAVQIGPPDQALGAWAARAGGRAAAGGRRDARAARRGSTSNGERKRIGAGCSGWRCHQRALADRERHPVLASGGPGWHRASGHRRRAPGGR